MNILKKIKHHYYDKNYEMPNLVVITGQKCTLKCKHCANFSPYHSSDVDFYNMQLIINDLKNIFKRIKFISHLQIQGGDFFLHKDAQSLLEYVAKEDKIKNCTIATNCILIPKEEALLVLKNKKFTVRISHYGTANEKNENLLVNKLSQYDIQYSFHKFANGNGFWSDCGGINTSKHTYEETVDNYSNCIFKVCTTLENGIISRCSRATIAHKLQDYKIKRQDYVNVRSVFFSISSLKKFIKIKDSNKGIVTACFYCNGTSGSKINAGEQLSLEEYKQYKAKTRMVVERE